MTSARACARTSARGGVAIVFQNGANVEQRLNRAARAIASLAFLGLAGCGGGGGGNSFAANTAATTPSVPTVPSVSIGPANIDPPPAAVQVATGATPTEHSIPLNTKFTLIESVLTGSGTSVSPLNGGTATLLEVGGKTSTGFDPNVAGTSVFLLTVPGVALPGDANLPADGSTVTLSSGATAWLSGHALNYTSIGFWDYVPASGNVFYYGSHVSGYQTPASGVPGSGSGTYLADGTATNGIVLGNVWVPNGIGGISVARINGQGSVGVNFATGALTGSLTNMTATASASDGGLTSPWNNVTLTGTLSGASISGNTQAGAAPSGAGIYGVSIGATGKFTGALYGPNGQELGAVWTLNDGGSTNGKTAVGMIEATKQ